MTDDDKKTDSQHNALTVNLTVVKSDNDIGKRFNAADGKFHKEVLGALASGTALTQTLSAATAEDLLEQLSQVLLDLVLNQVILLGVAVDGKTKYRLTTKDRVQMGRAPAGAIARTKENFRHSEPLSILLIDNDDGRETSQALETLYPPFRDVAMLVLPSSSSAVMLNGVPAKNGGEHVYMITSGGHHQKVLKRLLDLCALNGLARILITKNGRMLLRGPVDASVWGAERVIFPGVNHVVAPVEQGPREPLIWNGDIFDSEKFLSDAGTQVNADELRRVIETMKAPLLEEADRIAEAWGRDRIKEAIAKGCNPKYVRAQVKRMVERTKHANRHDGPEWEAREHETLEADFIITLSDGTKVTVREIVANPKEYEEKHCADPFEGVDYGTSTATILVNGRGEPWVYSHAHGATTDYHLVVRELIDPKHRYAKMSHEERLAEANGRGQCPQPGKQGYSPEDANQRGEDADLLIRAAVTAGADETVRDSLKAALKFMAGMGADTFNKKWRRAEESKSGFEAEDAAEAEATKDRPDDQPPRGYRIAGGWMCKIVKDDNGRTIDIPICHPLMVVSRGRNAKGEEWGVQVEFKDLDNKLHRVSVPMALLGGDAREALDMLTRTGLHLAGAAKEIRAAVIDLLIKWTPDARVTVASRVGWVSGFKAFVLGNGTTIGDQSYIFQPAGAITSNARGMRPKGTIEDWRHGVAALAPGNPVLMLALSAAFAGPLLEIINAESGGIQYRGGSSNGKTTVLLAAASVWGEPKEITMSWRATANGLEAVAAGANGTLLVLDEINMVSGKEAGAAAYMLANERGKQRADRSGGAREAYTWKFLFQSSGEIDLASKMNEDGVTQQAGQEIRLLDIVVEGHRFGVFDALHGAPHGAAFSDRIRGAATAVYGTAGPLMVEKLIADIDGARARTTALIDAFIALATATLGAAIASQVMRAMRRFAVVAAAGELASAFGVTGWQPGEVNMAALAAFSTWVEERGIDASANAEQRIMLERARDHLAKHGASRYERHPVRHAYDEIRTPLREGWMDEEFFWVADHAWKDIFRGMNHNQVAKVLAEAGYLVLGDTRHIKRKKKGLQARCYCIRKTILAAQAGMTAEEIAHEDPTDSGAEPEPEEDSGGENAAAKANEMLRVGTKRRGKK